MRRSHFELLKPICPVCNQNGLDAHPLKIAEIEAEVSDKIWEGRLICDQPHCGSEFPILDGMPILLPNLRAYVADQLFSIYGRDDLSPSSRSLIGDCCSQNSHFDVTRQHLSCYVWDHYGQFDPDEASTSETIQPGSIARVVQTGLMHDEFQTLPDGPILDAGCSVGRTSFEIAQHTDRDVLGIDVNFSMLRAASRVLRTSKVKYDKRRSGLVYKAREFPVEFQQSHRVDFWICDAQALPFTPQTFAGAIAMNLLDSVPAPQQLIGSLHTALKPDARMLLASPYDWSTAVTPVEAWLGGHSQRGTGQGAPEPILQHLLEQSSFRITAQWPNMPWQVRMHDRSSIAYHLHMVCAQRV